MAKENKTVYVILGLLSHEELTGYEIKKRIDLSLSYFWGAGFGQIYPALKLMEERGLVRKKSDNMGQKLERIKYSITEEGKEKLKSWLSSPVNNEFIKYEILLKLFFGSNLSIKQNIDNISAFKQKHLEQIPILEGYEKELRKVTEESQDHLYYLLTVLFGEKIFKAYTEWADEAINLLKESTEE
ncbi:transcriptional regulator, PadR family [Clostridiales bacterium oral taxon 876 str. F0540]|nr:transcriptional regulator, PadR family [Clostridiales bacterium oral taxon 876 str. F0540]